MSLGFLRGQHCPPPVLLLRAEQGKARASLEQGTGEVLAEVGLPGEAHSEMGSCRQEVWRGVGAGRIQA